MNRRISTFFVSLLFIFTCIMPGSVMASENFGSNVGAQEIHSPLPALENVNKLDVNTPNETVLSDKSENFSELMTDRNVKILSSYGINAKNNVASVKELKDNKNNRTISEVQYTDSVSVGFDGNGNIISVSNFNKSSDAAAVSLETMTDTIVKNSNLNGYKLVSSKAFDDDYLQMNWEKDIGNGALNSNDSLKVVLNRKNNSIVAFNRFNMTPNTTNASISEDEALRAAQSVLNQIPKVTNTAVSLSAVRPNYYWNDGGPYEVGNSVRLAYIININKGEYQIYIDAVTGENLGGDESKKNGKAFAWTGFSYAAESASLAKTGMSGLGYSTLSSWVGSGSGMGTSILNYWGGSSSYGFYVDCHGSSTTIADNSTWSLSTSNVSGNWNLVFLDACSTGASTAWASAFNIYGYSGRAFLGWYQPVNVLPAYQFNTYFWPEVVNGNHSNNVRDAAVWAASQVSGSTPIRFYGDSSYNGRG